MTLESPVSLGNNLVFKPAATAAQAIRIAFRGFVTGVKLLNYAARTPHANNHDKFVTHGQCLGLSMTRTRTSAVALCPPTILHLQFLRR